MRLPWYIAHSALAGQYPRPDGCGTAATSPPAHTCSVSRRNGSVTSRPTSSVGRWSRPGSVTGVWPMVLITTSDATWPYPVNSAPVALTVTSRAPASTSTPAARAWRSA